MESAVAEHEAADVRNAVASLETILCTEELQRRPARPPDYEKENRALSALVKALADSPRDILQILADTILETLETGSAGISLLSVEDGGKRFYWPAIAGAWKAHIGSGTPRDFGPCGDVFDRNAPLLLRHVERRYAYFLAVTPLIEECLLVPFYIEGKGVGTIWAVTHDEQRKFDAEDLRQLESLGCFASAAYQATAFLGAAEEREKTLGQNQTQLARRNDELQHANAESRQARSAALNLMQDAVMSRQAVEKLNAELRESEQRYRTLFDLGPVAVYSIDTSGLIQDFNRRAAELWGRKPGKGDTDERFCGSYKMFRPDGSFMPHDQCPMAEVISGKVTAVQDAEVNIERPDGSRVTVLVNIRQLKNNRGEITGAVNCFYDITERKQGEEALRQSEERFRMMADNISQLAWTCDQLGTVTWYNQRWLDYTGLTFEEMRDWGWTKCHHPDHVDRVVQGVQRSRDSGEVWEDTFPLRGKDGNYRWFLSRAVPIRDAQGNILRWFGTNTDITTQRNSEDALRRAHELISNEAAHLETLVQDRTARLQETIAELEHFSYTITHDMRAPLRAMRGFGSLLLNEASAQLTPQNAEYVRRIMNGARRMDALVTDSLQYAKAIRERLPLTSVQPALALRGILESYPGLQPPHVEIQLVEPFPPVMANESGLAQCFSNLLANAIKFVKPGLTPKIRIWAEEVAHSSAPSGDPTTAAVRFWFEDNGIGIPPQYHDRIFQMFQQLDKSYEGTGIGLALVRKAAERMNGKVGVESAPGTGSRFWLEFKSASPRPDAPH